jgi:hypothetical protein
MKEVSKVIIATENKNSNLINRSSHLLEFIITDDELIQDFKNCKDINQFTILFYTSDLIVTDVITGVFKFENCEIISITSDNVKVTYKTKTFYNTEDSRFIRKEIIANYLDKLD